MRAKTRGGSIVGPETTVREILTRFPSAEVVFERHGLLGCGGPNGPREPVGFFARVHRVEPTVLLKELNDYIANQQPSIVQPARPPVIVVYPIFLITSLAIAIFAGFSTGVVALTSAALDWAIPGVNWLILIQTHGRLQLYGWAGLFVFGVAYHIVPRFVTTPLAFPRLARASYWLVLVGLGISLAQLVTGADTPIFHLIFTLGLAFLLLAAVCYAVVLYGTVRASQEPPPLSLLFMLAGTLWLILGTTVELVVGGLSQPGIAIPSPSEEPALEAVLEGFLAVTALGVSLRTLPVFAGLAETRQRILPLIFAAIQIGVAGLVLGVLLSGDFAQVSVGRPIAAAGAVVLLLGIIGYLWAIRLFESSTLPVAEMGTGRGWIRAVRFAYGWFLIALIIQAVASVGAALQGQTIAWGTLGAARHAIALGFVTLMIVGMASRVIPVFAGKPLWKAWLVDVATGLLVASLAIRVPVEVIAPYGSSALGDLLLAISGPLAWFGLIAFAINFAFTMSRRDPAAIVAATAPPPSLRRPLRSDDLLADALRIPGGLSLLLQLGLGYLAEPGHRAVAARSLTIAQAVRRADQDPQRVLDALNQSLGLSADAGPTIEAERVVADVLEHWPATLDIFLRYGFTPLADPELRQRLASTITVGGAAASRGIDVEHFLRDLRAAVGGSAESSDGH